MSAVFLTNDLLFSSRVTATARAAGHDLVVVGTAANLVERVAAGDVRLVLVDLSLPGLEPGDLTAAIRRARPTGVAIVAYAPHVHESKLAAAKRAGCDEVLSRGQFNNSIEPTLARYLSDFP